LFWSEFNHTVESSTAAWPVLPAWSFHEQVATTGLEKLPSYSFPLAVKRILPAWTLPLMPSPAMIPPASATNWRRHRRSWENISGQLWALQDPSWYQFRQDLLEHHLLFTFLHEPWWHPNRCHHQRRAWRNLLRFSWGPQQAFPRPASWASLDQRHLSLRLVLFCHQ